jgi:hypothetical protein
VSRQAAVEIYEVKDRIVLAPLVYVDVSAWGATGQVTSLVTTASAEELGAALAESFEQGLLASEEAGREATKVLLKAAGVRSHAALEKKARYVIARRDEDETTVT